MSLGAHKEAVNELVDLFRKIARSNTFPNARGADITVLSEATQSAWEHVHGTDKLTWSDIKSSQMRSVWEAAYASKEFETIEPALQAVVEDLSNALVKRFRGNALELIGEDIISDMQNTIYARAVGGTSNQFFESLIQIYRGGAWPCGWQGDYPSGNLRTFASQSTPE